MSKLLGAVAIFGVGLLACAGIDAMKGTVIEWPVNVVCSLVGAGSFLIFSSRGSA